MNRKRREEESRFSLKNNRSSRQNSKKLKQNKQKQFLTIFKKTSKYLNDYNCLSKKKKTRKKEDLTEKVFPKYGCD